MNYAGHKLSYKFKDLFFEIKSLSIWIYYQREINTAIIFPYTLTTSYLQNTTQLFILFLNHNTCITHYRNQ
jgi:hypothetical protein